jgi:hypothetical protein
LQSSFLFVILGARHQQIYRDVKRGLETEKETQRQGMCQLGGRECAKKAIAMEGRGASCFSWKSTKPLLLGQKSHKSSKIRHAVLYNLSLFLVLFFFITNNAPALYDVDKSNPLQSD